MSKARHVIFGGGRRGRDRVPLHEPTLQHEDVGQVRTAQLLFDAHAWRDVRATSGGASDFYGPGGTLTQLGDYFWPRVL